MTKRYPCPVKGCTFRGYKEDGLWRHLYMDHNKNSVINALMELLRERR